jgi:hypothetical protein
VCAGRPVATSATRDGNQDRFEVPASGTYTVSIEVGGSTGEIILRELN